MRFIGLFCIFVFLISCSSSDSAPSDQTEPAAKGFMQKSVSVQGETRDFILYVPQTYSSAVETPLLFSFHGHGRDMQANYDSTMFHQLAEEHGFIVVHPQGVLKNGKRIWNTTNLPDVHDLEFFDVLLRDISSVYNINSNKVYSTGLSNGAYFSFVLACQRSNKIASVASVAGSMTAWTYSNCNHDKAVPVLHIHGSGDQVVNYDNNVPDLLTFWITHNGTAAVATTSKIKDINEGDPATVEKYVYSGGRDASSVQHLKIIGGRHRWPGAGDNEDLDASLEVWNFLKDQTL